MYGPQIDHTLQTSAGSYLYADRGNFDISLSGVVIGPTLRILSEFCSLTLWAHMGETPTVDLRAVLDIFVSNSENFYGDYYHAGSIAGPIGSDWKKYSFSIGPKPSGWLIDMYVYPMYSVSYDLYSEVGIDDIKFENCAVNIANIPQNQSLDCTFENGFCNYYLDSSAQFLWELTNTETLSTNTGPGADRNLNKLEIKLFC
jgi:hypothetical protein